MILVTGSAGLIGQAITSRLRAAGDEVREFDIRRDPRENLCDPQAIERAVDGVDGVISLAAVSRVVWGQNDPDLCWKTNVIAIESLLETVGRSPTKPWVVHASSREVYGQQDLLPVGEDAEFRPVNIYARSKAAGEQVANAARDEGLLVNLCRFSNVYGRADDHVDRVVNAFARASADGSDIVIEGRDNVFDFTQIDDVADGLLSLIDETRLSGMMPPIHFVSGVGTTLGRLAEIAVSCADSGLAPRVGDGTPRDFDVARFVGDPGRARDLLGWEASTTIESGFRDLRDRHAKRLESESSALT